jgi:hypothetical protein
MLTFGFVSACNSITPAPTISFTTTPSPIDQWAAIDSGPKYPAGNYQFDMLEVVKQVFGAETFAP